jgi:hypothetical protein
LFVGDHREQVTSFSVVHDHIDVVVVLDQPVHRDDGWVSRRETMQGYFASLKVPLAGVEAVSPQAFDGAMAGRVDTPVEPYIDNTVGASPNDREQLDATIVDIPGRTGGRA